MHRAEPFQQVNVSVKPAERERICMIAGDLGLTMRRLLVESTEVYYRLMRPDPSTN